MRERYISILDIHIYIYIQICVYIYIQRIDIYLSHNPQLTKNSLSFPIRPQERFIISTQKGTRDQVDQDVKDNKGECLRKEDETDVVGW